MLDDHRSLSPQPEQPQDLDPAYGSSNGDNLPPPIPQHHNLHIQLGARISTNDVGLIRPVKLDSPTFDKRATEYDVKVGFFG